VCLVAHDQVVEVVRRGEPSKLQGRPCSTISRRASSWR
jgi:hypothetical protein